MQIIQGLLGMAVGFLILLFRARIKDFTGDIGFAERYLGPGGTWTLFIIIGVATFILSLMWATGTLQSFTVGTFGSLV
ncbi:MAG: hypothetical protein WC897_03115 [Candidatus Gracilibacteria bacterium]